MKYDSTRDTFMHIESVRNRLWQFCQELFERAQAHDESKLDEPEKSTFDRVTPLLKELTYGREEYKAALADMGDALKHHYAYNSHHPEHYPNGVNDMNLIDIIEMLCDWRAASERHAQGNFAESLRINAERFAIGPQLAVILWHTARHFGWIERHEVGPEYPAPEGGE